MEKYCQNVLGISHRREQNPPEGPLPLLVKRHNVAHMRMNVLLWDISLFEMHFRTF